MPMKCRVQWGDQKRFAQWSDWIEAEDLKQVIKNNHILSIIPEIQVSIAKWNEYAKKYLNKS